MFLITGIPRSGTSLISALLSSWSNIVVFNEPGELSGPQLSRNDPGQLCRNYLEDMRTKIVDGQKVFNKYSNKNETAELVTDTWDGIVAEERLIHINHQLPCRVGAKMTMPFLEHISTLLDRDRGFKIVAMVRHPVDTILSWKNTFDNLRECSPGKTIPWSRKFKLLNDHNVTRRQVFLWRQLEHTLYSLRDEPGLFILKYEELINNQSEVSHKLCDFLNFPKREWNKELFTTDKPRPEHLSRDDLQLINADCMGKFYH